MMEAYLEPFVDWVETLSPLTIYLVLGFIAWLENVFPPIPGDLLVAFGGYLVAIQLIGFMPLLLITTITSVIGFMCMYAVGAYFGEKIAVQRRRFWLMRFIDVKYYDKGRRWMSRWGQGVILANRFLAGTRSVISLTAGVTRTRISYTVLSSAISSILWNAILIGFGWIVAENWQTIGHYLNIYGWFILIVIVLLIAARLLWKWGKKRRN
ncbi:MAG: DedA family protein [Balneolaceae bacterium]|nr:DedA family protein [Balneolaceae bacterium]